MQAIRCARPGGSVGYVGVPHGVEINGEKLFYTHVHLHGGPRPGAPLPARADRSGVEQKDQPRPGLRPDPAA